MTDDPLDPVWKALANPFRRKILDLIREGAMTTGELSAAFPELSRYAVMQHLDVLEKANLIVARREGRQRYNHLNAVPIRQIYERWVSRYEGHWASALVALKRDVESKAEPPAPRKRSGSSRPAGKRSSRSKRRHGGSA